MLFGSRHAHVQQPAALATLRRIAGKVGRKGVVVYVHAHDALELQPLGAVVGGEGDHVLPLRRRFFAPEGEVGEQVLQGRALERLIGVGGEEGVETAGEAGPEARRDGEEGLLVDERLQFVLAHAVREGPR